MNDKLRAAIMEGLNESWMNATKNFITKDEIVEIIADRISREFCVREHDWTYLNCKLPDPHDKCTETCMDCGVAKEGE